MNIMKPLATLLLLGATHCHASEPADPQISTLVKIDDFAITNVHFAIFSAQNAANKNSGDTQQQIALLNELVNTFMVANSADGRALEKHPEIAATLQVAKARLIAQALIRDRLENSEISDDALQAAYKAQYKNQTNREYKARHILLDNAADANSVIEALNQGADFVDLAKTQSTGPSKSAGGDLGWFSPEIMAKDFSAAIAQLEDGSFSSAPVKTQFGWHVILREATRDIPAPPLEEVRDTLTQKLRTQNLANYIRSIRENSNINVQTGDARVVE